MQVEDRRLEAEKEMVGLRSKCDSLQSMFDRKRQECKRLKQQLVGLVHSSGRRLDRERIEQLERQVANERDTIRTLQHSLEEASKRVDYLHLSIMLSISVKRMHICSVFS